MLPLKPRPVIRGFRSIAHFRTGHGNPRLGNTTLETDAPNRIEVVVDSALETGSALEESVAPLISTTSATGPAGILVAWLGRGQFTVGFSGNIPR